VSGVLVAYGTVGRRDVAFFEGAKVTLRERAVFDCLRILAERPGLELLERALQQGWVTLASLGRELTLHIGQHGVPKVRRLVRAVSSGERSAAERLLTRLLGKAGITGWSANAPISDRRGLIGVGDVVFVEVKVVLEVDGWAYHCTVHRFQRDRSRQNRLVQERPEYVVDTVRAILNPRS
jgi:hypothetical protein